MALIDRARGSSSGRTSGSEPENRGSNPCPRALSINIYHLVIMFYVYWLESQKNGKIYTGSTDDLKKRFREHNEGAGGDFTAHNGPWKLIHYEAYIRETDAREMEQFYKSGVGREVLKKKLKHYFSRIVPP